MSQGSTEKLRGSDYVLALLWLTRARAAAAVGFQTTFVFRPGGVAGGNVYTSWPTLYAALSKVAGPKWVQIDDTIVSPAVIPAGAYALDGVTIVGVSPTAAGSLAAGVTITANTLTVANITLTSNATAPVWTVTGTRAASFFVFAAQIICNAAGAFLEVSGAGAEAIAEAYDGGGFGDGAHTVLAAVSGGTLVVNLLASALAAGEAVLGGSLFFTADSTVNLPQGAGTTLFLLSQASRTAYTPATAGNWNPVPTEAAAALDALAAPNESTTTNGAALGPALTVTLQSAAFTRALSGKFVVAALLSGIDAGDTDTVTAQLLLDGAPVGPVVKDSTAFAGDTWNASITWIVTVADAVAHHASISATGASDVTVAIGQASVVVHELP